MLFGFNCDLRNLLFIALNSRSSHALSSEGLFLVPVSIDRPKESLFGSLLMVLLGNTLSYQPWELLRYKVGLITN